MLFGIIAFGRSGIRNSPMRGHRMTWPDGTDFVRGIVANREDEVELRCVRPRELVPAFRTQLRNIVAEAGQQFERTGMNLSLGEASCATGTEPTSSSPVHDRFGENGPC